MRLEDLDRRCEANVVADHQRRFFADIVIAVEHEAASSLDRPAAVDAHLFGRRGQTNRFAAENAQLAEDFREAQLRHGLVDPDSHRSFLRMGA
jgi:hypothetical protein